MRDFSMHGILRRVAFKSGLVKVAGGGRGLVKVAGAGRGLVKVAGGGRGLVKVAGAGRGLVKVAGDGLVVTQALLKLVGHIGFFLLFLSRGQGLDVLIRFGEMAAVFLRVEWITMRIGRKESPTYDLGPARHPEFTFTL